MEFQFFASSTGAPALMAIFCFPILKGSPDSLAMRHQLDVCTPSQQNGCSRFQRWAMFLPSRYLIQTGHALSSGSPGSIRFFQPLSPATPTACLTVSLAYNCYRRRDGVTTFLLVDPLDDLGAPSTPVVLQFRAGSYKTCILTTCRTLRGAALYLLILVGKFAFTTLTDI